MSEETVKMCFKIDPDGFTDLMHNLVLEGRWFFALQLMMNDFHGMTYEFAIDFLRGKKRICMHENGELYLDDDDIEKWKAHEKQLVYMYSSIVKVGTEWYMPIAHVSNFGPNDLPAMHDNTSRHINLPPTMIGYKTNWGLRAGDYATPDEIIYHVGEGERPLFFDYHTVIFRQCGPPPIWMSNCGTDYIKSIRTYLALGRTLQERGHMQKYGLLDEGILTDKVEIQNNFNDTCDDFADDEKIPEKANTEAMKMILKNTPPELLVAQSAILGHIMGECDDSKPYEDTECNGSGGWILPDGRFFSCSYYKHIELADRIWKHIIGKDVDDGQKAGEKLGWFQIKNPLGDMTKFDFYAGDKEPTQAQINKLSEFCDRHSISFPKRFLSSD